MPRFPEPKPALSLATVDQLPAGIRPGYDPRQAGVGVVHLGVGNFFRAHQALYLDEALQAGEAGWAVCGVSLRSPDTRDALAPQDGLYTVAESDADATRVRVIGALRELLVAPADPQAVIDRLASAATRWVTLTITEKGYGHRQGSELDIDHPDIAHDLRAPAQPRSAVGLLHRAALLRRDRGLPGLTLLSCDNLSGNGRLLQRLLLDYDRAVNGNAGAWIADRCACPDTMVDRIVPRTNSTDQERIQALTGLHDRWPIMTESFRQWVIADTFAGPRPELERSGVQIVTDVEPWERMKLRLLNASHSAIAWLGMPAGFETVDQAIAEPGIRAFIHALWQEEVWPTLPATIAAQAPDYCASLLVRFANPGVKHRTAQIAMDGSQKLPLRILPSLQARRAARQPAPRLTLVAAAWIRYLAGRDERGEHFEPDDPLAARLRPLATRIDPHAAVRDVVEQSQAFGDLAGDADWLADCANALATLRRLGSLKALEQIALSG